jgi:hypothetical protein
MTRTLIIAVALAAALGGCVTVWDDEATIQPSAAVREDLQPLAGHWQGMMWEVPAHLFQGVAPLDIQLEPTGRWTGTIGRFSATGTARVAHGWLVLSGTAIGPYGERQAIFYELKGDGSRRWGQVEGTFASGRLTNAQMSLQRLP